MKLQPPKKNGIPISGEWVVISRDDDRVNIEHIDESSIDPSLVESCLSICRTCEHMTTEPLTADDDPGWLVRTVGNVIGGVMQKFGAKAMRCDKCGCFVSLKARLLSGAGCPMKKWPNDVKDEQCQQQQ